MIEACPRSVSAVIRGWLLSVLQKGPVLAVTNARQWTDERISFARTALAAAFVDSGLADRCARVLVEPTVTDPHRALAEAAAIERVLADAGIELPQVHHGEGIASWVVNARAFRRGHGIRTGLEDTPVLIDGTRATGNGELVSVAAGLLAELGN